MKLMKNKKGQAMNVGTVAAIGIGLATAAIVFAVYSIVLAAFNSSTSDANATAIITNGQNFMVNLTTQFGTIGTVGGVLLLLGLVLGTIGGGYMMYQRYRG